jgi:hypothetical protein
MGGVGTPWGGGGGGVVACQRCMEHAYACACLRTRSRAEHTACTRTDTHTHTHTHTHKDTHTHTHTHKDTHARAQCSDEAQGARAVRRAPRIQDARLRWLQGAHGHKYWIGLQGQAANLGCWAVSTAFTQRDKVHGWREVGTTAGTQKGRTYRAMCSHKCVPRGGGAYGLIVRWPAGTTAPRAGAHTLSL